MRIRQTVKCNGCGGIYERHGHNEEPYFHVCATVLVDGEPTKREGHRDENPRVDEATSQFAIVSEGAGYTVIHDGRRTAYEIEGKYPLDEPLRAKRQVAKKKTRHGKRG